MKLCGFEVGLDKPFFLIAGPCVIESEQMALDIAGQMKEIADALAIPYIFKASYDKANRSSGKSFRGLGMDKGLEILARIRREIGVPVLTDVHDEADVAAFLSEIRRYVPEREDARLSLAALVSTLTSSLEQTPESMSNWDKLRQLVGMLPQSPIYSNATVGEWSLD